MDHADMEKMDNKIAVMIDSDNTQLSKLESVLQEVSTHGRIVVKRAYGNWQKENLKHWESELKRLAIKAEQQFDYTVGKNATDMALVIDTITLLHRNIYDAFVIVSSAENGSSRSAAVRITLSWPSASCLAPLRDVRFSALLSEAEVPSV